MIEFKTVKRSKGKFTKDLSTKNFYKDYCRASLNNKRIPVDYAVYYKIIRSFNKKLQTKLVTEAKSFKMPYKLGYLGIVKYEVNFDPDKIKNWKVNYGESKKQGSIIYYDQPFRYKWKWDKSGLKLTGKKYYKFSPCREASRAIPRHLETSPGFDYYEMLSKNKE
jgi:hypothetical protein